METTYWIGIDPGLDGAVAVIMRHGDILPLEVQIFDTPSYTVKKGAKTQRVPDATHMAKILEPFQTLTQGCDVHAVLEQVSSQPKEGVASAFKFGTGWGIWLGILAAFAIPHTRVTPQAWKKLVGIPAGSSKDDSRRLACQLYPQAAPMLACVKDDGRADALLMAEYCRRTTVS